MNVDSSSDFSSTTVTDSGKYISLGTSRTIGTPNMPKVFMIDQSVTFDSIIKLPDPVRTLLINVIPLGSDSKDIAGIYDVKFELTIEIDVQNARIKF